jgi:hypothetical protein
MPYLTILSEQMNHEREKMKRRKTRYVAGALCCLALAMASLLPAHAQQTETHPALQQLQQHREAALQEKLYLHLDRPVYACGEVIWFKAYATDGAMHMPLGMSKVAYVELLDAENRPALQAKIALEDGVGNGSFVLPTTLQSGRYTVRAYTNWMKNFDPAFYFQQQLTIVNTFEQLPKATTAQQATHTLQLFPEGGHLVAGQRSKVAFKMSDRQQGTVQAFAGEVHDQQGNKVAEFAAHKFGMGQFAFTPAAGMRYTATVRLASGKSLEQALPQVHDRGYTLQLSDSTNGHVQLSVRTTGIADEQVYLLAHARQQVVSSERTVTQNGTAVFRVQTADLVAGITHFTLFNGAGKPVAERLYFKHPDQVLQLGVTATKANFSLREQVQLQLQANNQATANLSMAVYRLDSLQQAPDAHIDSHLWLTSDLKGSVEQPAYYFSEAGRTDKQAIDNLMLTHGWSRFAWETIMNERPLPHRHLAEAHGHLLFGKVTNKANGQPAVGITTYLASPGHPLRFYNATSDAQGQVLFVLKDYFGSRDLVLQTDYTRDSTYHLQLQHPFSERYTARQVAPFMLDDTYRSELTDRHMQLQVNHAYHGAQRDRFRAPGIDSSAFYGIPAERYLLDDYKRFKVMEEVMREYVPGVQVRVRDRSFHFMVMNRPHKSIFRQNPMVLLDGVPVFNIDKIMAFDPLKVKQLDVITSRFFHGPQTYEGLVSYQTYNGDLAGFELGPHALMQAYEGLQLQREFYAPAYDTPEQKRSRLADFRNLLHWAPEIKLASGETGQVSFYTSDQPGTYLVVVQGLSATGETGYQLLQFEVNNAVAKD